MIAYLRRNPALLALAGFVILVTLVWLLFLRGGGDSDGAFTANVQATSPTPTPQATAAPPTDPTTPAPTPVATEAPTPGPSATPTVAPATPEPEVTPHSHDGGDDPNHTHSSEGLPACVGTGTCTCKLKDYDQILAILEQSPDDPFGFYDDDPEIPCAQHKDAPN